MKEIYLGTFYGNELILKVPKEDHFDYVEKFENYIGEIGKFSTESGKLKL